MEFPLACRLFKYFEFHSIADVAIKIVKDADAGQATAPSTDPEPLDPDTKPLARYLGPAESLEGHPLDLE